MSFDITPAVSLGRQLIKSYGDGGFNISDQTYDHPVIIFPERTLVWTPGDLTVPTLEAFSSVFDADPPVDILLVGCGLSTVFMPLIFREMIKEKGVVIEPMDTGSACRTYNVLLAEERRVAAALIPV